MIEMRQSDRAKTEDGTNTGHKLFISALWSIVVIWLVLAGLGIWNYAAVETEPPVFDALSYAHKAQAFWTSIESGKLFNPLSLEPTIRPFGTVLVSYPFGYSEDFRGFYFRTMFIPVVILIFAFMSISSLRKLSAKQQVVMFAIAIAVSSAPSNFQFQLAEGKSSVLGTWGFVDAFLSGILALTTALIMRYSERISVSNAWHVAMLGAFSLLVKPSALMLMVAVGLVWVVINFPNVSSKATDSKSFKKGLGAFFAVYGVTVVILLNSKYLSLEHARFGIRGIELIRAQYLHGPTIIEVIGKFHIAIGGVLSVYLLLGLVASARQVWRRHLYAALLVLALGFWLWLGRTSINNVRYVLPFLMMALVIVTPAILNYIERFSRVAILLMVMILLTPTLIIGYLLSLDSPPKILQQFAGINLISNIHSQEVAQANALLDELIAGDGTSSIVYYCGTKPKIRAFEAVLDWDRIVNGSKGHTIPALPIDWVREHAYRIDELRRARFIVFEKIKNYDRILATTSSVDTFDHEQVVMGSWLNSLNEKDGVRIHSEGSLRVLEVISINAFDVAATKIYHKYKWRKAFLDGYKQWRVTSHEFNKVAANLIKEAIPLRYHGDVVASLIGAVASRDGDELKATIYIKHIRSLQKETGVGPWFVFVQLLNAGGVAQSTANEPISMEDPQFGGISKYELRLQGQALGDNLVIATGIFSPQANGHVYAESKDGDWGGMRNLIVIPALKKI